jgi:hypothetical protein
VPQAQIVSISKIRPDAVQTTSTPLDRGSIVPLCVVCIEAGRATEATYQTRDFLCGCDQHIQELEQHGRAAVRRARRVRSAGAVCGALAAALVAAHCPAADAEVVLNVPGTDEPPVNVAPGFWPANAQPEYISYPASVWPLTGTNTDTLGQSVSIGQQILDAKIKSTIDPIVAGISEGAMVVDAEEIALENDPNAPLPSTLTFIVDEDPNRGLGVYFRPGTYIPFLDFTTQPVPDSQYNTEVIVNQYDPLANPPDRPWDLLADINAVFGLSQHTGDLNPRSAATQVTTVTDSRGGTITTYFIADPTLPLTQWLVSYKLLPQATVNQLNTVLRPLVDYGYSNVTPNDGPYLSEGQLVTPAPPPEAAAPGATSANAVLRANAVSTSPSTNAAVSAKAAPNAVSTGPSTNAAASARAAPNAVSTSPSTNAAVSAKAAPNALTNLTANAVTVNTPKTLNTGPAGISANVGLPAKVTATTTTAATGLTGGNRVVVGNGTKARGGQLSSALPKFPTGLTNGSSNVVKCGK